MKATIDTNVILDCLLKREPFAVDAREIFNLSEHNDFSGFVTASSVTDIYYILRKTIGSKRAVEAIRSLLMIFDLIDVVKNDLIAALELNMPDFEDALVASCAKRVGSEYIVTRNVKDFISSPVKPILPNEFIAGFFSKQQ